MSNKERNYTVLVEPHLTEKVSRIAGAGEANQVAFKIAPTATKTQVAAAVKDIFDVSVTQVRVVNIKGKRGRNRYGWFRKQSVRKAYVRLKKGDEIDFTKF